MLLLLLMLMLMFVDVDVVVVVVDVVVCCLLWRAAVGHTSAKSATAAVLCSLRTCVQH